MERRRALCPGPFGETRDYNSVAKEREGKKYIASYLATKLSEDPYAILVAKMRRREDSRLLLQPLRRLYDLDRLVVSIGFKATGWVLPS